MWFKKSWHFDEILFYTFFSGTRNVVAECLGKLCLIKPEELLPQLQGALSSPSPLMRTTVVTAMKFTISDQPQTIDALLRNCIGDFLGALTDPDLNVRRVALVAFNSAAHNKPSLIRDLLRGKFEFWFHEKKILKKQQHLLGCIYLFMFWIFFKII